ncbi:MAG TPA: hypothetical protein DCL61_32100 [Cyanobacteria bacterium UBA12227]|nr:hypothetical protein [Cyanobacteria bacterium UBA12227]HAX87146.1 hypothetical protein [Cyanobacteria bacterium UBA11370]HBY78040.1 hypothetical protein [Cyanobacteria bacterium UBA11148]
MNAIQEAPVRDISPSSCSLAPLFAEIMRQGQIEFTDWYELMTAPLEHPFSTIDEDILTRLIYGVHRGIVKIVEKP